MMAAMDMQLLPAASRFIGCAWAASPSQLGAIIGAGALLHALAIPLGGLAGVRGLACTLAAEPLTVCDPRQGPLDCLALMTTHTHRCM